MMVFKNVKISDYNLVLDEIFKKNKSNKLFLLNGEIGSGKTTLIKSFLKRLLVKRGVSSPTFNIINEYSNDNNELFFHFDLYTAPSLDPRGALTIHELARPQNKVQLAGRALHRRQTP